jgi:threonine dehydrogenase-like Zn-dependent dehydrogenase
VAVNPLFPCRRCANCLAGRTNACMRWRLLGFNGLPGAMAEQVVAPALNCYPLADGVSDESAATIEPLACAVHLMSLAPRIETGTIAIFGAGTLGAMILRVALIAGYGPIWLVDKNEKRLAAGSRSTRQRADSAAVRRLAPPDDSGGTPPLGSPQVEIIPVPVTRDTDPAGEILAACPDGVEVAVDAIGIGVVRAGCAQAVRKSGTLLLLGLDDPDLGADAQDVVRREVRLQGCFAYTDRDFARAQRLVEAGRVDIRAWTEELPLAQGQRGFEKLAADPGDTLKILLKPGGVAGSCRS